MVDKNFSAQAKTNPHRKNEILFLDKKNYSIYRHICNYLAIL